MAQAQRPPTFSELAELIRSVDMREAVFSYDRDSDTLMLHFFGRGRPATSVPVAGRTGVTTYARVDRVTGEIVGAQIEGFLRFAQEHPVALIVFFVAELRGITPEEVRMLHEGIDPNTLKQATIGSLFNELGAAAD